MARTLRLALTAGPLEGVVEPKDGATARLRELGAFIREQRSNAEMSLRGLAAKAGISNPYLSQIERGLRKPSAEILQRVAQALRISAETLYVQAGILEEHSDDLAQRISTDRELTEPQKRVLLEVYESLRSGTSVENPAGGSAPDLPSGSRQR
jgi:transcriptional regulator with XRE-family HTH domain